MKLVWLGVSVCLYWCLSVSLLLRFNRMVLSVCLLSGLAFFCICKGIATSEKVENSTSLRHNSFICWKKRDLSEIIAIFCEQFFFLFLPLIHWVSFFLITLFYTNFVYSFANFIAVFVIIKNRINALAFIECACLHLLQNHFTKLISFFISYTICAPFILCWCNRTAMQ